MKDAILTPRPWVNHHLHVISLSYTISEE